MTHKEKEKKKEYDKRRYQENKAYLKEQHQKYYEENKEQIKKKSKRYRKENTEKVREYHKEKYQKNKEQYKKRNKKNYEENKEEINKKQKKYREENKEQIKKYYRENKKRIIKQNHQRHKIRYQEDVNYRITNILRSRLRLALKGIDKAESTMTLLGCSVEQLRTHLEAQFVDGMTWDNYGYYGWHIDHIRPCASFDLTDPQQQLECFHYTNLQPLWAEENLKKGDKYD